MMLLGNSTACTLPQTAAVPYRASVYVACSVAALASNYLLGKDMPWDLLNYHVYAGFAALNNRFGQDYFPAGPQSYLNPFAYVPFYALIRSGLPALAISSTLALAHSVILWLTYELAASVCPSEDRLTRLMFGICAVALAFVNPILMQEIGSSFADITTGELVLGGWLLLAGAVRAPSTTRVICAAVLLGAATALKPTNALHAITGFVVLAMLPLGLRGRFRHGLVYGISLGLSFVIVCAPWSYRLAQMFGNPVFPLLNGVFRSPEFTVEPMRHFRFIPETFAEAIWRPFAMIDPVRMVHEELRAPDPRYALLQVLVIVIFYRWLRQFFSRAPSSSTTTTPTVASRTLVALGCGFAADWVIWLSGSGNSRYFLPMACVAAVLVVALLFHLFADRPKVRNYILIAIFATQAAQLAMGAAFRWNPAPWDGPWFRIAVPQKLAAEPNLYLTIGSQSNSFIAPFLAPDAGLVNFSGGYALAPQSANGTRVKALISRYAPHLRVLVQGARLYKDDELREPRLSRVDDALARYGLHADMTDCATIPVQGLPPDLEIRFKTSIPIAPQSRDTTYLVSCHLLSGNSDQSAQVARQRAVDLVLDRLEDACPELFQPRRLYTERDGNTWRRLYFNTDLAAWVSGGWVKFANPLGDSPAVHIGRESDWAKAPQHLDCGRRDGKYYVHFSDENERPKTIR